MKVSLLLCFALFGDKIAGCTRDFVRCCTVQYQKLFLHLALSEMHDMCKESSCMLKEIKDTMV